MTWDENPTESSESPVATESTPYTPAQTPRWVRMLFKTLGIFSFIFVIFSAFLLFSPTFWNGTIPPYFILTPIISVIGLSVAGYGFFTFKRWMLPLLYIYGVSNALQFIYYAITGGYGQTSLLIPLIGTLLIVGLCRIAYLQRSSFSGNYFHSLFSTLLIVCMIAGFVLIIMMSKNAAFDVLISDNATSSDRESDLENISEQKETSNENLSAYEQNINANKNLKIILMSPSANDVWSKGSSYPVIWNVIGLGQPPYYLHLMGVSRTDAPATDSSVFSLTQDIITDLSSGTQTITVPLNKGWSRWDKFMVCVYGSYPHEVYEGGIKLGCSETFSII